MCSSTGTTTSGAALARVVLKATDGQTRLLITEKPLTIALRNLLAPFVTRLRKVQQAAGGQSSGISATYRACAEP